MSVKIELVFSTEDEAIVALAAVRQAKQAMAKRLEQRKSPPAQLTGPAESAAPQVGDHPQPSSTRTLTDPAAAADQPKRTRKPRADAGKPRGPHKTTGEPVNTALPGIEPVASTPLAAPTQSAAPAPATPAASAKSTVESTPPAPAAAVHPAVATPTGPVPTLDDVQKATADLFAARDYDDTKALVSRFGVARSKDIPADMRAEFIQRANEMIADKSIAP